MVVWGRGIWHHCGRSQAMSWGKWPNHLCVCRSSAWVKWPHTAGLGHLLHAELLQTWCHGVCSSQRAWARCRTGSSVCSRAAWVSLLTFLPCLLPGYFGLA